MDIKIKDVTRSIKKRIDDTFSDIYVYYDSTVDTSKSFQVLTKVDVPALTTTFIIYDYERQDRYIKSDLVGLNIYDYSKNKRQIIAYDELTGEVTIDVGFDEDIYGTDTLSITIGNNLFLRPRIPFNDNTVDSLVTKNVRYYYTIKTVEDPSKEIIMEIASRMCDIFVASSYPIYDELLVETGEYYFMSELPSQASEIENAENFQSIEGTMLVKFYKKR